MEFYSAKTDRLRRRQVELEAELALVHAELERASGARDQLAEVLAEITDGTADSFLGPDPAEAAPAPTPEADESGSAWPPSRPAVASQQAASRTLSGPGGGRDGGTGRARSGERMQAILQILVTAARPMRVRDITEALGRPVSGHEGRAPIETTRSMCKRLVKNGRAVEGPAGVFAVARAEEPYAKGAA
ncbi:hypothetical protein [Kitasatospora sp. NPDC096204]|uniref:hypothetical protein n=1 Tax=Kitasatospora sp. NPDC096204 TaxID=3364094 RepID=UPI00382DFCA1